MSTLVFNERLHSQIELSYTDLVANFLGKVRSEHRNGREYLVAPVTSLKEGVLVGSKGALFYPNREIQATVGSWNDIPLTLYHPYDPLSGKHLSAKSRNVLDRQGLGWVKSSVFNDKLQHEAWFDVEITKKRDSRLSPTDRIIPRLLEGRPIELSTGLFTRNIPASPNSNYHGKRYDYIATRYKPDHLAILPNQIGACSVSDGCGVLVNAATDILQESNVPTPQVGTQPSLPSIKVPPVEDQPAIDDGGDSKEAVDAIMDAAQANVQALEAAIERKDTKVARGHLKAIQQIIKTAEEAKSKTIPKQVQLQEQPPQQQPSLPMPQQQPTPPANPAATNPAFNEQSHGVKIGGSKGKLAIYESDDCHCGGTCKKCKANNATSMGKEQWIGNETLEECEDSCEEEDDRAPCLDDCLDTSDNVANSFLDQVELAVYNARWPQHKRDALAKKAPQDFAGPHKSFPIKTQKDVKSATRLRGHAANPNEVASKIKSIAKRKGLKVPQSLNTGYSNVVRFKAPGGQMPRTRYAKPRVSMLRRNAWSDHARELAIEARRAARVLADTAKVGAGLAWAATKLGTRTAWGAAKGAYQGMNTGSFAGAAALKGLGVIPGAAIGAGLGAIKGGVKGALGYNAETMSHPSVDAMACTAKAVGAKSRAKHITASRKHRLAAIEAKKEGDISGAKAHSDLSSLHMAEAGKEGLESVGNAARNQPRCGDSGKYMRHNAGTGKGPAHKSAQSGFRMNAETCNCSMPTSNSKGMCVKCGKLVLNPTHNSNPRGCNQYKPCDGSGPTVSKSPADTAKELHSKAAAAGRKAKGENTGDDEWDSPGTKEDHAKAAKLYDKSSSAYKEAAAYHTSKGDHYEADKANQLAKTHSMIAAEHKESAGIIKPSLIKRIGRAIGISNTLNSQGESPMVETREQAIDYLVENCSCERSQLENFSDEALAGIYAANSVASSRDVTDMEDGEIEEHLQILVNEAKRRNNLATNALQGPDMRTGGTGGGAPGRSMNASTDDEEEEDAMDGGDDEEMEGEEDDTENFGKGGNRHSAHAAAKKGGKMRGKHVNLPGHQMGGDQEPGSGHFRGNTPATNSAAVYNALTPQDREFLEMGRRAVASQQQSLVDEIKQVVANTSNKSTQQSILNNMKAALQADRVNERLQDLLILIGGPVSNRQQPAVYGPAGVVVENRSFEEESAEDAPMPKMWNWKQIEKDNAAQRGNKPLSA